MQETIKFGAYGLPATYTDNPGPGQYVYMIYANINGQVSQADRVTITVPQPQAPAAPQGTATLNADGTVVLSITPVQGAQSYAFQRCDQSGNVLYTKNIGTSTTYTDNPGPGTYTYKFYVAVNGVVSPPGTATVTVPQPQAPAAPQGTATVNSSGTVTLSINPVSGAQSYAFQRCDSNGNVLYTKNIGTSTTYTDNPGPGTYTYKFYVAVNDVVSQPFTTPAVTVQ